MLSSALPLRDRLPLRLPSLGGLVGATRVQGRMLCKVGQVLLLGQLVVGAARLGDLVLLGANLRHVSCAIHLGQA